MKRASETAAPKAFAFWPVPAAAVVKSALDLSACGWRLID